MSRAAKSRSAGQKRRPRGKAQSQRSQQTRPQQSSSGGGQAGFDVHPSFKLDGERLRRVADFVGARFLPQLKAIVECTGGAGCAGGASVPLMAAGMRTCGRRAPPTPNRRSHHEPPPAAGPVLRRWWRFRKIHRQFGWKFWAVISGGAALEANTEEFWRRLGYVVIQGTGTFVIEGQRLPFGPGDFLFAPARVAHRFEDFSDDLAVWVFFYGPEGGEAH